MTMNRGISTMLSQLEKERKKDMVELDAQKKIFADKIKKMKKSDIVQVPKKMTLWQKIKILILGN